MPESPEVAALASALDARMAGLRVDSAHLVQLAALKTVDPQFTELAGCRVLSVGRIGKFLSFRLVTVDGEPIFLVIHLARAGWVRWIARPSAKPPRPGRGPLAMRLTLINEDEQVAGGLDVTEAGTRKRLAVHVVRDPLDVPGVTRLGPDPLADDFTEDDFRGVLLDAGAHQIKGVLRDQSRLAGIGNAWSDEILHAARLSPFAVAARLTPEEERRLFSAVRSVLREATERCASAAPETLKSEKRAAMSVHGRAGQPCPACGTTIHEVSFADSTLQYCPACQTGGRILADRRLSRLLK